jgi:Phosphate transport regulator (distant homolog of PhoU)
MKLTLMPQGGRRFYELFRKQGELVSQTLTELSKSLLEGTSRHARLRELEHTLRSPVLSTGWNRLENEGDRITREAIGELFSKVSDAAELVKWKDIYDLLEATMDACEQAANVMETISIKNA